MILPYILLGLSLLMIMIGGWMDITKTDSIGCITKHHFWNDGIYLAIISIFILIITIT
jgi:hypothetical protein